MQEYIKKIYKTRYFWSHLAKNDLRGRFRRSKLGLLWSVIQPLMFTSILAFVLSSVLNQDIGEYALYILSGIVVWNMLQMTMVGGGSCLFSSEQYIRQFNHPITIYTLRYSIVVVSTFLLELLALVIWVLFNRPMNLLIGFASLPITLLFFLPLTWSIATIAGYSGAKYRDYPQIMSLLMQMIYYISPVFFKEEMFESSEILKILFQYNPITHILSLVRYPFVYGRFPNVLNYAYVSITIVILMIWAMLVNNANKKKVIFYL